MDRETCPSCGGSITSVDRFCQNCGTALTPHRADQPTAPPRDRMPALLNAPVLASPSPSYPPPAPMSRYGDVDRSATVPSTALSNAPREARAGVQPLLEFDVAYPERLSRLLIFVKWLLIIPHLIVLMFLGIGLYVVTFIAWFAILFTGRYPRGMWGFSVDSLRWAANTTAYQYLQRDDYPPFSGTEPYPVHFQLDYPARLSRLLIFVKWLLVLPHLLIVYVLGLVAGIVLFFAWFAILFVGRMPRGMHDFLTGYSRWLYRIFTYLLLLTDAYPPFTMDHIPSPTRTAGDRPALPY